MSCEGIDTSGIPLTVVNLQPQMRHAGVIKLLDAEHSSTASRLRQHEGYRLCISLLSAPAFWPLDPYLQKVRGGIGGGVAHAGVHGALNKVNALQLCADAGAVRARPICYCAL